MSNMSNESNNSLAYINTLTIEKCQAELEKCKEELNNEIGLHEFYQTLVELRENRIPNLEKKNNQLKIRRDKLSYRLRKKTNATSQSGNH